MHARFSHTVPCQSSLGRPGATRVTLDQAGGRVVVLTPTPAGSYDWRELDDLIAALQAARALLPGASR